METYCQCKQEGFVDMVTKDEIVKIARINKLPLGIIEKDYVLTYILKRIYESPLKKKLIFKGGTALHKLYLHKRISIDLDFTELIPITIDELKSIIQSKEIKSKIKEVNETNNSTKTILSYNSVLEYKNNIVIDISRREKPLLATLAKELKSPYFKRFNVLTFQLEELISEKIRAIIQRNKPRDYLDLYYILSKKRFNLEKAMKIAKQKVEATGDKFDIERIFGNLDLVKNLWNQDLNGLLIDIPEFDKAIKKIRSKLTRNGQ